MSAACFFKAFSEQQYATDFLDKGRMRFAMPSSFGSANMQDESLDEQLKRYSNPRFDFSEGTGKYVDNNGGRFTEINTNPTYLFCCAQPDVDQKHLSTFGTSIVKILSPDRLLSAVSEQIRLLELPFCDELKWIAVKYDKGIRQIESTQFPWDEGISQKPPEYAFDKEIRLILQLFNLEGRNYPHELFIEIGNVRSFCELT